ncbi:MAG TPA: alpha/beta fold hydrolase [Gaiella sp.]|uniref:alpha/beta hydrolase family protein n=1 Tax=Gaiella sp. TaxID=2663207 RepID=UPI002D7ED7FC|nr:alpha/beta fold hydrolase [Gaiella sp.]HET9288021.1 alpha/beta fold hydrolase [Gaiella sp.]
MHRAALVLGVFTALLASGCGGGSADDPLSYEADEPLAVERGARTARDGVVVQAVSYASGDDRVDGYLVSPSADGERLPAVVFLHGAGGDRGEQLESARALARRGAIALTVTAPSRGKTAPAGLTTEELVRWQGGTVAADLVAVRRGLDLLAADDRVDADRLGVVGWSMGGRLAAIVAGVDERVRATVLMSVGAAAVDEYVGAAPPELQDVVREVLEPIDPLTHVAHARGAMLVQAGRRDEVVPQEALHTVIAAAPADTKVIWYAADHGLDERAGRERLDWLARELDVGRA